ncbi:hypothetical protein D9Q98_000850 [Chlorella vulgaris]|uniref:Uncharacterized protein n=1 Tax=Chlorella vulgaris TaxID=3077 RepID=A0A9D4TZU1_CHLVU|nr:hypothetical protein D9Q98_000850 [Chlorella vulgaris]
MQSLALLPPGVTLDHPFFLLGQQQAITPASSADEADLQIKNVLKSPLAKHDQVSAAQPSPSEDDSQHSGGAPAVDSRPAGQGVVDQPPQAAAAAAPADFFAAAAAAAVPRVPSSGSPAPWLMGLFESSLFEAVGCPCHPGTMRNGVVKRNENNQYCLGCTHAHGVGMCKLCLPAHAASCPGRVFQIRKYMYQTCVHVEDIQPLYDVSGVQAYCINSRRAVLIQPKNMEKEQKCPAFDHTCTGCHKPLRHDCTYCSLRCKVDVQYGLAPSTPRGAAATTRGDSGNGLEPAAAAAAAAMVLTTQPRQQAVSRMPAMKRSPFAAASGSAAAAAAGGFRAAACSLDVSHATRCSSGLETAGSSRSKRRKTERPARSHIS